MYIDPSDDRNYSKGIIVLDGSVENGEQVEYHVDYRAFRATEEGLIYEFDSDNGVGRSTNPESGETSYTVSLMVPVMYQENTAGTGTINYQYVLEIQDPETELWESFTTVAGDDGLGGHEYLVNEYDTEEEKVDITQKKSENIEEYNKTLFSCSLSDSKYRIMRQLYFGVSEAVYKKVFTLDSAWAADGSLEQKGQNFRIRLQNINGSIPSYVQQMARIIIQVDVTK